MPPDYVLAISLLTHCNHVCQPALADWQWPNLGRDYRNAHCTLRMDSAFYSGDITLCSVSATRGDRMTATQASVSQTWQANLARLERLAGVLSRRGLRARVIT